MAANDTLGWGTDGYTHGPGADEPLAVVRSGARYAYHADGLGSVTKMTDGSEGKVRSYRYDAFGRITAESGSLANFYAFTGREWSGTTELYHYRARSYDPEVGRFLQKDPAGEVDGPNLYLYVGNNPVNLRDPSGKQGAEIAALFGCLIVTAYVVLALFELGKQPKDHAWLHAFPYIFALLLFATAACFAIAVLGGNLVGNAQAINSFPPFLMI